MSFRQWRFFVLIAVMAGACYQLFLPPRVGLADQGDFARSMEAMRLSYRPEQSGRQRHWCFFNTTFGWQTPNPAPPAGTAANKAPWNSSAIVFGYAALGINSIAGKAPGFDIGWLALTYLAAFLGTLAFLLRAARDLRPAPRWALGGLVVLMGTDVGYVAYFNSLYQEPATVIFGLLFLACAVWFIGNPRHRLWGLAAVSAALVLFVAAKTQNEPLILVGAAFMAFGLGPLMPKSSMTKVSWAVVAVLMCGQVALMLQGRGISDEVKRLNLYNAIFMRVLPASPTPGEDLQALGLDPSLATYSGTSAFEERSAIKYPQKFPNSATYGRLIYFHVMRPARLLAFTSQGVKAALSNRAEYLGNFESSTGLPCQTMSSAFTAWNMLRSRLRYPWLVALVVLGNIGLPLVFGLRIRQAERRALLLLHASIASMATLAFYTAIFGDGNEWERHLFLFNFLMDCCLAADLVWLTWWASNRAGQRNLDPMNLEPAEVAHRPAGKRGKSKLLTSA